MDFKSVKWIGLNIQIPQHVTLLLGEYSTNIFMKSQAFSQRDYVVVTTVAK